MKFNIKMELDTEKGNNVIEDFEINITEYRIIMDLLKTWGYPIK